MAKAAATLRRHITCITLAMSLILPIGDFRLIQLDLHQI
ncbi:hypothetical protein CEV32_3530 [Brucella rhizosphaerae]|uniref:Uncharacterized protein n=1 Tax=Brucella rhizosphaerae TaxID=571254 RepID=A0A256FT93_9HYPH|nr:hypothetical protein CEV32_3530 [Brucella rhizosphaerae]